jgi:hypothetical protein
LATTKKAAAGGTMRRFSLFATAVAVALLTSSGPAPSADNIGIVCTSDNTPADQQIAACSKIIAMRAFSGAKLSTLYFWRAVGYSKKGDYTNVINDASEGLRLCVPFAHDVAFDPGRASALRMAVPHILPSSE